MIRAKAAALGYAVNSTPAVGAIAWEQKAPWGHVAWVSAVSGSRVTIEEYNYLGTGVYSTRTVSASSFRYIHFKDLSSPTTPPPTNPGPTGGSGGSTSSGTQETTGGSTATWSNYSDGGGAQGQTVPASDTVQVACKVSGLAVSDGDTWWYLIAASPWSYGFYASADAFYNNGTTSGSLHGTPLVDPNVPDCANTTTPTTSTTTTTTTSSTTTTTQPGIPAPPPTTQPPMYSETTGGVTHTWTNYSNAGGTAGQAIGSNQTVQVSCKVNGFRVSDGDTWWYRIASSPWNGAYYASADAFYNNGGTSGSLSGTPFVDGNVPNC